MNKTLPASKHLPSRPLHRLLSEAFVVAALAVGATAGGSAWAGTFGDVGRVAPASMPLPLPGTDPMPPNVLRSQNPQNLPMTGVWRFELTHGGIKEGKFVAASPGIPGLTASSYEEMNPPSNAFDGDKNTRWCASGSGDPQWLQADLGKDEQVTGVDLTWEHGGGGYRCRVEGKLAGGQWVTLADASAASGVGDGPLPVTPATVRIVRVTVVGETPGRWASVRELTIHVAHDGQNVVWQPPTRQKPADPEAARDRFAATDFDDAAWDDLPVPSNWEMYGYSEPTYGSVDHTVGQYRRWVEVPADWTGKSIYWHFDGALDGAEVFVNGQKAGYHESGYTAWDIDLTGLVKAGERNLFAVRVSKSTPSDDCETGDFQCMGGIYRDTSLIAVPKTHVTDLTVQTPLDADYHDATLNVTARITGTPGEVVSLQGNLVAADTGRSVGVQLSGQTRLAADGTGTIAMTAPVQTPALWTAETPSLYYTVLQLASGGKPVETVEQRFGFKQIEFKDNRVLWNGRPIKCTGTCRHDFWADRGFALTEENWQQDLAMMKAANINAVRTSHYNHAQRFLELCEEKGMYILDEVPYCWIDKKVNDTAYAPYLLQRAAETLARDKNRPCVLAWSIGNENPMGVDSQAVIDLVKSTDPTRPAFVSCTSPQEVVGQLWRDDHYPGPGAVDNLIKNGTPVNFSEHPHIFWQPETQEYDPGTHDLWAEVMCGIWGKVWTAPTVLGSFIWEWQNQGILPKNSPPPHVGPWGPDNLFQENDKGVVTAFRVPKPEWWIVKQVYSPVQFGTRTVAASDERFTVPVINRYAFTDLNKLACRWTVYKGGETIKSGVEHLACAPGETVQATFPAVGGATKLRLEFVRNDDGSPVVAANLAVDGAPVPQPPAALAGGNPLTSQDGGDTLRVSNDLQEIVFDKRAGTVQAWRVRGKEIVSGGPILNLGEAKKSDEKAYYRAASAPVAANARVTAAPAGNDGTVRVSVSADVLASSGGKPLGKSICTYDIKPDAQVTVRWNLEWQADDENLWEEGLKIAVPPGLTHMGWFRDAYLLDYPAGDLGEPLATCRSNDLRFRASKRNLHWMTLADDAGNGLVLLPEDGVPLTARADAGAPGGTMLFASREVAGPTDFSGSWVEDHRIKASKGKALSGAFTLRATAAR